MKFHVNASGEVGKCSATQGKCPFGGSDVHADSREGAAALYERRMEGETSPIPLTKSTRESLLDLKSGETTPLQSVQVSLIRLEEAEAMVWERTNAVEDLDQKALLNAITREQLLARDELRGAEALMVRGWAGTPDAHPALPFLTSAHAHIHASAKLVGDRLEQLWDRESRRYRDPTQTAFLHDLMNAQVLAMNKARFANRDLQKELNA